MSALSRAQIDRLGERLRAERAISSEDRILLDEYRRSLTSFSHAVTQRLEQILERPITERPGKTTPSIVAKLKRQSIALSRIQDIAGGRVVVPDLPEQGDAIARVQETYPDARLVDRRESPIVGYHAAHFVIREGAQTYELQIRTEAQQRWAQLSEKFADLVGFEIKYGGGPELLARLLTLTGEMVYVIEQLKMTNKRLLTLDRELKMLPRYRPRINRDQILAELAKAEVDLQKLFADLEEIIERLERIPK